MTPFQMKNKKTSFKKTGNIENEVSVLFNRNTTNIPNSTHVQNRVQNHVQNIVQNEVQNSVQNRVQNHVRNCVRNHVRKIKKICNKNMSFLKITDPKKRYFIVNEFLKTRQNIQQNILSERVGDLSTQYEPSQLFKPVTDMQTDLKEGLVGESKPIREGMKNLPKAITFPHVCQHVVEKVLESF